MSPTFDFLVKIDEIYVTSRHFGEMSGTLTTKGLLVSPAMYVQHTSHHSVVPAYLGKIPQIPSGATAVHSETMCFKHKASKKACDTLQAVTQVIRNLIQDAMYEDYMESLEDPIVGLINVDPINILLYILQCYAK